MNEPRWRISTYSSGSSTCVGVAPTDDDRVALVNTNRPDDGALVVDRDAFAGLLDAARGDLLS